MNTSIGDALQSLRPAAQWSLVGDELEWLDTEQTEPTSEEIATEVLRLQAEYDGLAYSRNRKAEYDKLNQDEMRFDDLKAGTTTWPDAIDAIKLMFPKPEVL